MLIELVKPWQGWQIGHRFPLMPRPVAKLLVQMQVARVVDDAETHDCATLNGDGAANARASRTGRGAQARRTGRNKR